MKLRIRKPREFAALKMLAAWRESEAQSRDVPRNRILKDEAIFELAVHQPKTPKPSPRSAQSPRVMSAQRPVRICCN